MGCQCVSDSGLSMWLEGGPPVGSERGVELSSTGLWWRVGTSEVSLARGLCESLVSLPPSPWSLKAALCVSVCRAATLGGQAPQGRGKVAVSSAPGLKRPFLSCRLHLVHPTQLCSADCPGLCPPPLPPAFASTLCGSSPLWGRCCALGGEPLLSREFGPRKLKFKESWLMACDLNL